MLRLVIPAREWFDEKSETFTVSPEVILNLEHSLISLSKWESKHHKRFLENSDKLTQDEMMDYVRCMTVSQNVDDSVYNRIGTLEQNRINEYINDSMTATTFAQDKTGRRNREQVSSELIYYWMIECGIPFECQKWHLNRLLTLIRVCSIKSSPPKKQSRREAALERTRLNNARLGRSKRH